MKILTFRNKLLSEYRVFMGSYLRNLRKSLGLTKEAMAERLHMDVRSYSDEESGKCLCGFITFVIILCDVCQDRDELLKSLKGIFVRVWEDEAA